MIIIVMRKTVLRGMFCECGRHCNRIYSKKDTCYTKKNMFVIKQDKSNKSLNAFRRKKYDDHFTNKFKGSLVIKLLL